MKLSVVILNYNVRYFLELCLKSVQEALISIDAEIIVIDNNSSDDSCAMVERLFPNIKLIRNQENIGFSKANNQAVKEARGQFICILNPDTVVAEDTFTRLIEFAQSKQNIGAIGCKLIDGTGKYLPESKRNVPVVKVAAQKMLGNVTHYYANHVDQESIGKVDILVGAFMFIKKEVYNEVGGFDEDYFMYGEDIDLSYKLIKAGYDNYYYGETAIIHYKGESTLKNRSYAKRFYRAMQLFYNKHFSKNIIFDASVWLGLQLAFLIRRTPKNNIMKIERYILISDHIPSNLSLVLSREIILKSDIKSIPMNSEIIFNANTMSYKNIIQNLYELREKKSLSFKILPKNSEFIIGSDDSINRGEIIDLRK